MNQVLNYRLKAQALSRLVSRGLAQIAALTPSDASHVLDYMDVWDKGAAEKALLLFGRRRTVAAVQLSMDACELAQKLVDQLTLQTIFVLWKRQLSKKKMTLARLLLNWPHILFFKEVFLVIAGS